MKPARYSKHMFLVCYYHDDVEDGRWWIMRHYLK